MFLEKASTNRMNFVQIVDFDWLPWQPKCYFRKKYSKIFSEVIREMKLKLCINVCVIMLYINYVFYCCCACGFVAMATLIFHRFIMGKVKIGLYFSLT